MKITGTNKHWNAKQPATDKYKQAGQSWGNSYHAAKSEESTQIRRCIDDKTDSAAESGITWGEKEKYTNGAGEKVYTEHQASDALLQRDPNFIQHRKSKTNPGYSDKEIPPEQLRKQQEITQSNPLSVQEPASSDTTTTAPLNANTLPSNQNVFSSSGYWVRIPYPLSPIYTYPLPAQSQPGSLSSTGKIKSDSGDYAEKSDAGKNTSTPVYYGGLTMSQLREATVDVVNEASDAIWKHTRSISGPRSDEDNL